jgi:hypothetical protein
MKKVHKIDIMKNGMRSRTPLSTYEHYVDDKGVEMVGVPKEEYEEVEEDLYDISVFLERKDETPIKLEEFRKWLEDEGLL